MEAALSRALELCPEYNLTSLLWSTFNVTTFPDPESALPSFLCSMVDLQSRTGAINIYINWFKYGGAVLLGLPSSIMAIRTFCTKEFDTVSFLYHRAINIIELFYTISLFFGLLDICLDRGPFTAGFYFLAVYKTYIWGGIENGLQLALDAIVVWVAVERALLCNSPILFGKVNKKSVAYWVIGVSIVGGLSMRVPVAFSHTFAYHTNQQQYIITETYFYQHGFVTYVELMGMVYYIEAIILIPATIITVYGLVQISKRKKKLIQSGGFQSASSQHLMSQIAVNSQLCRLQVCEAVPPLINNILVAYILSNRPEYNPIKLVQMTVDHAHRQLIWYRVSAIVGGIDNIVNTLAHSTHFYRYFIFSFKVRKAFLRKFHKDEVTTWTTGTKCPANTGKV